MPPNKLAFGIAALVEGNTVLEVQTCAGPIKRGGHFFCFLIKIGLVAKIGEYRIVLYERQRTQPQIKECNSK